MRKRLLYVVGQLGTGGHVRSALTYASELRLRGWAVTFCGTDSGGGELVADQGFPLIRVASVIRGEFFSSAHALQSATALAPTVVHSFDLSSLPFAARVAAKVHARHIHTVCGGKMPRYPIPTWDGLVVMSEELADGIAARNGYRPPVVPGRIRFSDRQSSMGRAALRRHFKIPNADAVALMISRTCPTKANSLRTFIAVVEALARRDSERCWRGIICGSTDDTALRSELAARCESANRELRREVFTLDTHFSRHAFELLPIADVFMGMGDAFAEAVVNRVPALAVGEAGFAGMLSAETERELYRFNLSGRNVSEPERADVTADRIVALLGDPEKVRRALDFARASVTRRLSAESAIDLYEQLYASVKPADGLRSIRLAALRALLSIRKHYLALVPARVRAVVLPRGIS